MTAKTIIRVKRRFEDDPANAIVLSYKRKRTEEASESTVLQFTGTTEVKDDSAATKTVHCYNHSNNKDELKKSIKAHQSNAQLRCRAETLARSKENRLKVLSFNRSLEIFGDDKADSEQVMIVDVDAECGDSIEGALEPNYVYDLYSNEFMTDDDVDDFCIEHILSVQPVYAELEYRESEDSEEIDPYDDDSNDECNWRNDYPDSDHSINDDDMRLAASMHGMGIDNGHDLTSDSEDEHYQMMSGLSPPRGYDAYKARVTKELTHFEGNGSASDISDTASQSGD